MTTDHVPQCHTIGLHSSCWFLWVAVSSDNLQVQLQATLCDLQVQLQATLCVFGPEFP